MSLQEVCYPKYDKAAQNESTKVVYTVINIDQNTTAMRNMISTASLPMDKIVLIFPDYINIPILKSK